MTVEAPVAEEPRAPDRARSPRHGVLGVVATAPERLLMALLWFGYVAATAYVLGFFRPVVVVPAAVVVMVLTARFRPGPASREGDDALRAWRPAAGSLLALAGVATWFLLNRPYPSERVRVDRDPDLYTLAALWLLDHPSPSVDGHRLISTGDGFELVPSTWGPQGLHLVSGVSAAVGWLFGEEAVLWGNVACGAAALLALYVLGRRLLGPFWALAPVLALGASLPMLEVSRALYSEPLAMTFAFLGTSLLWTAWKDDRVSGYLLAGAAFGGVGLARVDGTLPLIGVLVGVAVAAMLHPDRNAGDRRWAAPLVLTGAVPGVLLGLADGLLHSGTYVADLSPQLRMLGVALAVAAVFCLVSALVPVPADRLGRLVRGLRFTATAGAGLGAVAFLALLSRTWWYVGHNRSGNGLVSSTQEREGLPVDGTRSYAEQSFEWISWYYGWPVVLLGLGGLLAWVVVGARSRQTQLLWLSALFLPSAALYLAAPNITPDQIWAMRRFLPVVVPGMLLATVWVARWLVARARAGAGPTRLGAALLGAALTLGTAAWPLTSAPALWARTNHAGALEGNRAVCAEIDGRPTVVAGISTYLYTVLVLCDVPAILVREPTPELLAEARRAFGGEAFLVTHAPATVPWEGEQPPPSPGPSRCGRCR
ncbi:glycosyltransferase family 39 protein [Blastococcus sp. PRF04-17]|uniref:glycosyltransferase family 39 protein n=1 Tax=Blastococcus sp. PRF04-17 TaxID=2933797 RepID=UPI001FF4DCCF|nr:glycosyltransferase family 39 protein [Blastococcus sp. PRF04-17]UOY01180.1 glycosyltransferase family 39 protein [Blastococcus sp. PRF04-17]